MEFVFPPKKNKKETKPPDAFIDSFNNHWNNSLNLRNY